MTWVTSYWEYFYSPLMGCYSIAGLPPPPSIKFASTHLGGEKHCKSKVPCPRTQHCIPGQCSNLDWVHQPQGHCTSQIDKSDVNKQNICSCETHYCINWFPPYSTWLLQWSFGPSQSTVCKPKQTAVNKIVVARKESHALIEMHTLQILDLKLIWKLVKLS